MAIPLTRHHKSSNHSGNIMKINRRNFLAIVLAVAVMFPLTAQAENDNGWFGLDVKVNTKGISFNPTILSVNIIKVYPSSPAAAAGLAVGDSVVVLQGITVAGAKANDLKSVMKKSVGEAITMKVKRGKAEFYEVKMIAVKRPSGT
jgi:predicted metalloprotease with PDZ domain